MLALPRTKNRKSRHIPLNAIAMEALWILRQRHAEQSADSPPGVPERTAGSYEVTAIGLSQH
jgi:hypothetical protein